ncbi:MAG: hypothetical protein EH225_06105 [Calditrichaeota bacterium]|nr:hypothetical protein [Calditrichota bacterium]RQW04307.1 MAG: hypothetical protein EH225_06105 [Calditrichota bacterium]
MVNTAEESRNFLTRLWNLENDERPAFMIGYVGPEVIGGEPVVSALFSTSGRDTVRDRLRDPAKYLRAQIEEIESQLQLKGDFVPSLCPSLGVIAIASAFGCQVEWWENDFPAAHPLLENQPEKVSDLHKPDIQEGELSRILRYTSYFIEETNGRYPVRLTDIQGPLDNASLIMGHNTLMSAMLSHPQEVHRLMRMVTDLMIDFIKEQRNLVVNSRIEFVPSMFQPWLPDGSGVAVSNDDWVMISPEMHDEFQVPYLNQISEEFGGIFIHSCGNWRHQFSSLKNIHLLRGIEFGASEVPFKEVFEHWNGKIVLACRIGFNIDFRFPSMADYVRRIMQIRKTNRGLFINVDVTNGVTGEDWPVTDLKEIYQLLNYS